MGLFFRIRDVSPHGDPRLLIQMLRMHAIRHQAKCVVALPLLLGLYLTMYKKQEGTEQMVRLCKD